MGASKTKVKYITNTKVNKIIQSKWILEHDIT